MKKICILISLALLGMVILPLGISANDSDPYYHGALTKGNYWNKMLDNNDYELYRLPGVVVTKSGTVIVYGEARTNINRENDGNGDKVEMDLYLRRSTDSGVSFSDPIYIARGSEYYNNGLGETINNPAMIVGNDGRLHLLFSVDCGSDGVFYTYSDDDGVTWTTPKNVKHEGWGIKSTIMSCGPGHGICLDNGRLLVSMWTTGGVYPLYSDDNGATWKIGAKASQNSDETCSVKLSTGGVMFNSRQYAYPYYQATPPRSEEQAYRALTYSATGIDGWTETVYNKALIDPACEGGMCSVDIEGLPYALLFVNCANKKSRTNLTVKCSFNDGLTWEKSIEIEEVAGGYSDIAVDQRTGKVYVLYELAMGSKLQIATFSFYDVFCDGDATTTSSVTNFESPNTMIAFSEGVTAASLPNNGLRLTLDGASKASVTLSWGNITKNLSAEDTPILAMRVRVKPKGEIAEANGGVYLRCGYTNTSTSSLYSSFTVPNDGAYHTVLIDLTGRKDYAGTLHSMELIMSTPHKTHAVGDSFDIASFGFFADEASALEFYPADVPIAETDDGTISPKSGCLSVVNVSWMLFITVSAAALVIKKRQK